MRDLDLLSKRHLRYENGIPVRGIQYCRRIVRIKNQNFSEMLQGAKTEPECGFVVVVFNGDLQDYDGHYPMILTPKLMVMKSDTGNRIELSGIKLKVKFGADQHEISQDFEDFGITLLLFNRCVEKCILHRADGVDIEYSDFY